MRRANRWTMRWTALTVSTLIAIGSGIAFDGGAHNDMTYDALRAEGFGETAVQVVQVANWLVDFYESVQHLPRLGLDISGISVDLIRIADRLHFDDESRLENAQLLSAEWTRLARATRAVILERVQAGDIMGALVALGISLHVVQDFYAHTNWVEPAGMIGYDGPGWRQLNYGSHPTWFDIPADVRLWMGSRLYGPGGTHRGHGDWRSDDNWNLASAMNKDWPGRPLYIDAYITAYFATRQWVRAVRSWLRNEAAWQAMQQYRPSSLGTLLQLAWEVNMTFKIAFYSGHWYGQGGLAANPFHSGPGASPVDAISSTFTYLSSPKTVFRSKFEQLLPGIANPNPPPAAVYVSSSRDIQQEVEFVVVQITRMKDDTGDVDPFGDQADFYVNAQIAGQWFCSGLILGHDFFDFPRPNYPFTLIKAVPKTWEIDEPVTTLQVEVRTANVADAGTDDDVYLRINDQVRFLLDKPFYNDFERGDCDTYSLNPPPGLRVRDISYIQIEKSPDSLWGGWKLAGIRLYVNGYLFYENNSINRWLEDNRLTWRAPDFRPIAPRTRDIPITLQLWDNDGGLYGADDHCDIHPDYNRYDLNLLYNRESGYYRGDLYGRYGGISIGGSQHGGRGSDSDRCEIGFRFYCVRVIPPPNPCPECQ